MLANVDADLCAQVAAGLGCRHRPGNPAARCVLSPALSQMSSARSDRRSQDRCDRRRRLGPRGHRRSCASAWKAGSQAAGHRARSAASSNAAADTAGGSDLADRPVRSSSMPFVVAGGHHPDQRHQARRAAAGGVPALQGAGLPGATAPLCSAEPESSWTDRESWSPTASGKAFTQNLVAALGLHRAWDRAIAVMASAVPPAA